MKKRCLPDTNMPKLIREGKEVHGGISMDVYRYGELRITQSIDIPMTVQEIADNFGTEKLPIARYKHTAISHPKRYPTWDEILEVRQLMHGDVFVMQIIPPKSHYVNYAENCFHLWEIL